MLILICYSLSVIGRKGKKGPKDVLDDLESDEEDDQQQESEEEPQEDMRRVPAVSYNFSKLLEMSVTY